MRKTFFTSKLLFGLVGGFIASFFIGSFVFAQTDFGFAEAGNIGDGALGGADIREVIVNVVNIALGFLGIIAVIILIYGGWVWMTAGGNPERVDQAKRILRNGVIGIAIIIASWSITLFLINRFIAATGGSLSCPTPGLITSCNGGCGDSLCGPTNIPGPCLSNGSCVGSPAPSGLQVTGQYPNGTVNTNVCLNTIIFATFNEIIDDSTVATNFTVQECATSACLLAGLSLPLPGVATSLNSIPIDSNTVEFTPSVPLTINADYLVTVISDQLLSTGIASLGIPVTRLSGNYTWQFQAGSILDTIPPVVRTPTIPTDGEIDVCLETFLGAEFSEVMRPSTINVSTIQIQTTALGGPPTYNVTSQYLPSSVIEPNPHTAIIATPQAPHAITETYDVQIGPGVEDVCGNAMGTAYGTGVLSPTVGSWTFDTGATVQCLPIITGVTGTGYYERTGIDQVVISGRYLTPVTNLVFGNNTDAVISNSCLRVAPDFMIADQSCYQLLSSSPLALTTYLPSGQSVSQGAQDGAVRVTTPVATVVDTSVFDVNAPFVISLNSGRLDPSLTLPAVGITNFLSIFGNQFDQTSGGYTAEVWFTAVGATSPFTAAERVQADLPCAAASISDTQLIAAFPNSFSGSLGTEYLVQVEQVGGGFPTRRSNIGTVHLDASGALPGLCPPVVPSSGPINTPITLSGTQFSLFGTLPAAVATEVQFGFPGSGTTAVGNPPTIIFNPSLDIASGISVPSIQPGNNIGVFITDGAMTTNSVLFDVTGTGGTGPIIYDFIASYDTDGVPIRSGGTGQYITISGINFGTIPRQVRFYNTANDILGTGPGSPISFPGDISTFHPKCLGNIWSDTQIIVKVPLLASPLNGSYFLAVEHAINGFGTTENLSVTQFVKDSTSPNPGICLLEPANGVSGSEIDFYGDNFGSTGVVEFYNNTGAVSAAAVPPAQWNIQSIDNVVVPAGAETGPATVTVSGRVSNPYLFTVGLCNDPAASVSCLSGSSCCSGGTFDGQCRTNFQNTPIVITSCEVLQLQSVQSWSFTTGVGPGTSCQTASAGPFPANACMPDPTICGLSQLVCERSSCTCQPFGIVFQSDCVITGQSPSPPPGANDACNNSLLSIQFNDSLDTLSINDIEVEACSNSLSTAATGCIGGGTIFATLNNIATTVTAVGNDTVRISPTPASPSLFAQGIVYIVTVPVTVLSSGLTPLAEEYKWHFQIDASGVECLPDRCNLSPRFGGIASSLLSPLNVVPYTLDSARQCNLIIGNFDYNITSDDTAVGAVTIPLTPFIASTSLTPPPPGVALVQMTALGRGNTNVLATSVTDPGLLCRGQFSVSTEIPRVIEFSPSCDTAIGRVCTNATIRVTFSTQINKTNITTGTGASVQLRQCAGSCSSGGIFIALDSPSFLNAGATDDAFTVSPSGVLMPNQLYRVELDVSQILSATGEPLESNDLLSGDYVWEFTTKPDLGNGGICDLDHITILPETRAVNAVGIEVPFTGVAFGAPDECNPGTGQRLDPFAYSWEIGAASAPNGWEGINPLVADHARTGSMLIPGRLQDSIPPPGGDLLADPTQPFLIVGTDPSCQSPPCTTDIIGSVSPDIGVLSISCNSRSSPLNKCAQLELTCGYSTDDQCVTGLGLGPTFGISSNSCCALRPLLLGSNPNDGDGNVCRNIGIELQFDSALDPRSVSANIFLVKNVGASSCPTGTNSLLVQADGGRTFVQTLPTNPIKRIVFRIKEFIRSLFVRDASAADRFYTSGDNLCIVSSSISTFPTILSPGQFTVRIILNQILDDTSSSTDAYAVVVLGDDDIADTTQRGLLSSTGVTFVGTTLFDRGGIDYLAELILFNTGPDVCVLDHLEHNFVTFTKGIDSRTSHTFFCAGDTCPTDNGKDPNTLLPFFVQRPGNQHWLSIIPKDINGNMISLINMEYVRSGPDFFETCPSPSSDTWHCDLANRNVPAPGGLDIYSTQLRVDDDMAGYGEDVSGLLTVIATDNSDPTTPPVVVSRTFDIRLFVCNNPWPDVNNFPYSDNAGNCLPTSPGECQGTNFEFYYCRDNGGPGTEDDLPALAFSPLTEFTNPIGTGLSSDMICYGGSNPATECSGAGNASMFFSGVEGWILSSGVGMFTWQSTGGNPDGFMRFDDLGGGFSYLNAPGAWLGDWSSLDGVGAITYDHRLLSNSPVRRFSQMRVTISGPGGTAVDHLVNPNPIGNTTPWTTFIHPLIEANWDVTGGNWNALLRNVTSLEIPIELTGSTDSAGIDNISVGIAGVGNCQCNPGDTSCTQDGICFVSELKNLVFPREGVPNVPFIAAVELPPRFVASEIYQYGGDVRINFVTGAFNPSIGYKVYWGTSPTSLTNSRDLGVDSPNRYLHGLNPNQEYYFAVTSYVRSALGGAESGFSNIFPSPPLPGFRPRDQLAPFAPSVLSPSSATNSSITISWLPESNTVLDVANFELSIRVHGTTLFPQVIDVGTATTHTFNNLNSDTQYDIIIIAEDSENNQSTSTVPWTQITSL